MKAVMPRIQRHAKQDSRDILNLVLDTISGDAQERARVAADIANNTDKTERHDAAALKDQINYESKVPA